MSTCTYLLQRAKIKSVVSDDLKFSTAIELDYMGSAEFEFGALPRGLRRICQSIEHYEEIQVTVKDVKFNLFLDKNRKDLIKEDFLNICLNKLHLKDRSNIEYAFLPEDYNSIFRKPNIWWSLDLDYIISMDKYVPNGTIIDLMLKQYNDWYLLLSNEQKFDTRL